jgi:hypothetical protein
MNKKNICGFLIALMSVIMPLFSAQEELQRIVADAISEMEARPNQDESDELATKAISAMYGLPSSEPKKRALREAAMRQFIREEADKKKNEERELSWRLDPKTYQTPEHKMLDVITSIDTRLLSYRYDCQDKACYKEIEKLRNQNNKIYFFMRDKWHETPEYRLREIYFNRCGDLEKQLRSTNNLGTEDLKRINEEIKKCAYSL